MAKRVVDVVVPVAVDQAYSYRVPDGMVLEPGDVIVTGPPAAAPVANPLALIVATFVFDDAHVTLLVRFCVELSVYFPVAVNCCVPPATIDGFAGVTPIDTNVAAVTVSVVLLSVAALNKLSPG